MNIFKQVNHTLMIQKVYSFCDGLTKKGYQNMINIKYP